MKALSMEHFVLTLLRYGSLWERVGVRASGAGISVAPALRQVSQKTPCCCHLPFAHCSCAVRPYFSNAASPPALSGARGAGRFFESP